MNPETETEIREIAEETHGEPTEATLKEICKHWYLLGVTRGKNVEEIQDITLRAAESQFEAQWEKNDHK